jgi:hypothetical protein
MRFGPRNWIKLLSGQINESEVDRAPTIHNPKYNLQITVNIKPEYHNLGISTRKVVMTCDI